MHVLRTLEYARLRLDVSLLCSCRYFEPQQKKERAGGRGRVGLCVHASSTEKRKASSRNPLPFSPPSPHQSSPLPFFRQSFTPSHHAPQGPSKGDLDEYRLLSPPPRFEPEGSHGQEGDKAAGSGEYDVHFQGEVSMHAAPISSADLCNASRI